MIFTETKKFLAELIQTTLKVLSSAFGHMYTKIQVIAKINILMTDFNLTLMLLGWYVRR